MSKTIKSRIIHKHDIETNWLLATNFTPMNGEIIIYDEDENYSHKRIKIGDGKTNVNQLSFLKDKSLEEAIDEVSENSKVFYVTINGNETDGYTKDKTCAEINEAYVRGATVCCKLNMEGEYAILPLLSSIGGMAALFGAFVVESSVLVVIQGEDVMVGQFELASNEFLQLHIENTSNPHNVTKSQIGLGNVNNTSDMNKPVSTAQQDAINEAFQELAEQFEQVVFSMYTGEEDIDENGMPLPVRTIADQEATDALNSAKSYTDTSIANLVDSAPETMNTLKEVSDAIATHQDVTDALNAAIGNKANASDLTSHISNTNVHMTSSEKNKLAGVEDGAQVNIQSDWSINDEANTAYVKNRPFYDIENILIEQQIESEFVPDSDNCPHAATEHGDYESLFEEGKEYYLEINGQEYLVEYRYDNADESYGFGSPYKDFLDALPTGEGLPYPFFIANYGSYLSILTPEVISSNFKIYTKGVKTLDIKYLPEHLQFGEEYTVLFDQKVEVVEGKAEYNLQPDNYLDTTLGTQYVVEFNGNRYELEMVYDRLPEIFSLGVTYSEFHDYWGDVANAPLPFMISIESAGDEIYISAYEDGIYDLKIMCSPIIKHLDSKYIKDMYYETEPAEVTLIDEVCEGFEDWDDYYAWEGNILFEFVIGQNYTVTWDGITYDNLVCFDDDDYPTLGSPWGDYSEYPFNIYTETGDDTIYLGIYTKETETSHTIKITTAQSEIIKIDKKYLPQLVGESTTGNVYTVWNNIQGREEEHIASAGAEIFNDYAYNIATGVCSHAEGYETTATGDYSHAEGGSTQAFGYSSHAEGWYTRATGDYSHAEGYSTKATGDNSHAEGSGATASGYSSHSEGNSTKATGDNSHAEGGYVNGKGTSLSKMTVKPSEYSGIKENIDVYGPVAHGIQSHAEGTQTLAFGFSSHSEGIQTKAFGSYSHAEGEETIAFGSCSHSEGNSTKASGSCSHAEGSQTQANSYCSHAEGLQTVAYGDALHVQGKYNFYEYLDNFYEYTESADYVRNRVPTTPFLMGDSYTFNTITGTFTINNAVTTTTIAANKYIILDPAENGKVTTIRKVTKRLSNSGTITYDYKAITRESKYAHIVGNGDGFTRSNAHTLDWDGNAWFAGDVYVGGTSQNDATQVALKEPTGVTAGTYGGYNSSENYYYIPNITVDEYGKVTNASISYLDYADSKGGGLVDSTFYNYVTGNSHIAYRKTLTGLSTAGYSSISLTNIQNTLVDSSSQTYLYMPTVYNVFVNCKINSNGDKAFVPVKYYCGNTSSSNTATVYVQFPSEFLEFNNKEEDMQNGGLWATYYILYERPYTLTSYK